MSITRGSSHIDTERKWHVLRTRSRQEKALASDLMAMGIAHYLPLVRQIRYHGRRRVENRAPLFPGYIFLWGSLEEAYLADRTRRVAQLIRVVDQEQLEWELKNLRFAISTGVQLDLYPYLRRGQRVAVRAGPLRGLQGLVSGKRRENRLILQVDTFGCATSLEIDWSLLERVS